MRPLVTTVKAIKELATGLSPDAVAASTAIYQHSGHAVDVIVSADDREDDQRIILMRTGNTKETLVPEHLSGHRREVLSRIANFAERATTRAALSLPRGWHQYKHHNLIAFFAVPGADSQASRWIAEMLPGDRADIVLWKTTTSANKASLVEFEAIKPSLPTLLETDWVEAVAALASKRENDQPVHRMDVEISLSALDDSATRGWSYDQWMSTISDDQRSFIEATSDKSIRLRGPAGSGKTLALTLKAIREVLRAREEGTQLRVLVVTHSWSLASEISDSLDSMSLGLLREIDVFPLLEVAQNVTPHYVRDSSGFNLVGNDSFSGKQAQLDEIVEVLDEFVAGDWVTYKSGVSETLRSRFDSIDPHERFALAWDLLIEFGSVIGAAAIFPGAGAEARYAQLPRAAWMLPLQSRNDMSVIFTLYTRYMENLDARSLLTSDQVLADLLSHLETHAWNRARKTQGYDLVFVDEFHLFSPLERQVLHYLCRDVTVYPRIFMAIDPRQSPSEAFIGLAADETRSSSSTSDEDWGTVANFELTTAHRFTPEILGLIKHVHHEFPTLDLGKDWDIDFGKVESARDRGPLPRLISSASLAGQELDIAKTVYEVYHAGRVALAIVDTRQWRRFSELASRLGQSGKFHVSAITGRTDIDGLGYRRRGLVVGPAEYLAGLQFDTVLVAGVPNMQVASILANERTRLLSLLYLAISRAQRDVRVFVNDEDGGPADVLSRAVLNGLMEPERGSLV